MQLYLTFLLLWICLGVFQSAADKQENLLFRIGGIFEEWIMVLLLQNWLSKL